jgi:hypothetical protein
MFCSTLDRFHRHWRHGPKHGRASSEAGHSLQVFNRTKEKAQALLDAGAKWHDSAGARLPKLTS